MERWGCFHVAGRHMQMLYLRITPQLYRFPLIFRPFVSSTLHYYIRSNIITRANLRFVHLARYDTIRDASLLISSFLNPAILHEAKKNNKLSLAEIRAKGKT
jgi:hypothetical protein